MAAVKKATPKKAAPRKVAKPPGESDPAAVAAYLRALKHPLKTEIEAVRGIILAASPAISEGIKWNVPSFRTEKEWFATFNVRSTESVQLIFHLGAKKRPDQKALKLADPNGLIKWLGPDRAMITLGAGRDIPANRKAFEAIVRAWIKHV
jgi:hypothetical protein